MCGCWYDIPVIHLLLLAIEPSHLRQCWCVCVCIYVHSALVSHLCLCLLGKTLKITSCPCDDDGCVLQDAESITLQSEVSRCSRLLLRSFSGE